MVCEQCQEKKEESEFWQYKNGTYCPICKNCLVESVDVYNLDSFSELLDNFDFSYNEDVWIYYTLFPITTKYSNSDDTTFKKKAFDRYFLKMRPKRSSTTSTVSTNTSTVSYKDIKEEINKILEGIADAIKRD